MQINKLKLLSIYSVIVTEAIILLIINRNDSRIENHLNSLNKESKSQSPISRAIQELNAPNEYDSNGYATGLWSIYLDKDNRKTSNPNQIKYVVRLHYNKGYVEGNFTNII